MAVTKPKSVKAKSKPTTFNKGDITSHKNKKTKSKFPPKAKAEVKTSRPGTAQKKKKKTYTAEELGVPKLNGIVPTGVIKAKGKKKGKVYVDDADSMMAILGMVQAEKDGEREGKLMKSRQLEEIREAKRLEHEKRAESKKAKLEEVKDSIRKSKKSKSQPDTGDASSEQAAQKHKHSRKRVSFG